MGMYRSDPILSAFLDYWSRKRGDRPVPSRSDIDPAEIPNLLPHIMITEMTDGGQRFRCRLVGTGLVARYGRDLTGRYLDEVMAPERHARVAAFYRSICAGGRPYFVQTQFATMRVPSVTSSAVIAPLSRGDGTSNLLILAMTFDFGAHLPESVALEIGDGESVAHVIESV